ncbi:MAG: VanZ family protein [Betaproteobacteria bacterium]|nr:VanZ family protein [Betaproteobacteria bacterium]MBV9359770.1 VanZ family protein [Betaproteobacteria bacterium]
MRRALLIVGWFFVAVIWWLSLTPQPPHIDFEQSDKVGHFIAYGGTMFWFCLVYRAPRTRLVYAMGFIAMGVAIEYIQRWTGYRSFEVYDMVADALGVLLGWAVALAMPQLRR